MMTQNSELRKVATLPSNATVAEIKAITDRDGAVIVENVIPADLRNRINVDMEPWLKPFVPGSRYTHDDQALEALGSRTKRFMGLCARSDAAAEAMIQHQILGWAEAVLASDPEFGTIQLNCGTLIEIGPGEKAQYIHSDETDWPSIVTGPAGPGRPELVVGCMIALTDFTEENGATRVIPGSHRDRTDWLTVAEQPATVAAEMKAGSVLFYTGKVAHGGGANRTTNEARRGMVFLFSQGWLKPIEASPLTMSFDRAKQLPQRARELLGFSSFYRPIRAGRKPRLLLWQVDVGEAASVLETGVIR
jgi:ectoine hydroxylase-related dioxygenase (phytanoyl-CoA dioxygenase family)